eukprot:g21252.t1
MCIGTFDATHGLSDEWRPQRPQKGTVELMNGADKEVISVQELLLQALAASQTAPNRAVKRRVRQRLHKKLGAICNKEDRVWETEFVRLSLTMPWSSSRPWNCSRRSPSDAQGSSTWKCQLWLLRPG